MEFGGSQSRRDSVVSQPAESELVASREHDKRGSRSHDNGEGKRELNGRMHGLTGLRAGGKVSAGNDVQTARQPALTMRHISMLLPVASQR